MIKVNHEKISNELKEIQKQLNTVIIQINYLLNKKKKKSKRNLNIFIHLFYILLMYCIRLFQRGVF